MTTEATLAALLGSRICHDLISPIGAIGNGVELVAMAGMGSSPEMSLIEESVKSANTRIRYFRIAFGSASPGQKIANREIVEILGDMSQNARIKYNWMVNEDLERGDVKLVFLVMQCLESSMPYGGTIAVSFDGESWKVTGTAQKTKVDPELWSVVTRSTDTGSLTPGTVHFGLAAHALAETGRQIDLDFAETGIQARF